MLPDQIKEFFEGEAVLPGKLFHGVEGDFFEGIIVGEDFGQTLSMSFP